MPTIKEIVSDGSLAVFKYYRKGNMFYNVYVEDGGYQFPVDLADIGDATLERTEKAITLMRYIRKALEAGTFVKI